MAKATRPKLITGISLIEPRPAVAGFIKIGHTVGGRGQRGFYTRPEKFDHFEITTTERVEQGRGNEKVENLVPDLDLMHEIIDRWAASGHPLALCGGCDRARELGFEEGLPRRLPIYIPSEDLDAVFPRRLAWFKGARMFCHGNAEKALRLKILESQPKIKYGDLEPYGPCGEECPDFQTGHCKPSAVLRICLADQRMIGSVYQFATTSWQTIRQVLGGLVWVEQLAKTFAWIPLTLDLYQTTTRPKSGAPKGKAWVASINFVGTPRQLIEAGQQEWTGLGTGRKELARLVASVSEDPEADAAPHRDLYEVEDAEIVEEPESRDQREQPDTPDLPTGAVGADLKEGPPTDPDSEPLPTESPEPHPGVVYPESNEDLLQLLKEIGEPMQPQRVEAWTDEQFHAACTWAVSCKEYDLKLREKALPRPTFAGVTDEDPTTDHLTADALQALFKQIAEPIARIHIENWHHAQRLAAHNYAEGIRLFNVGDRDRKPLRPDFLPEPEKAAPPQPAPKKGRQAAQAASGKPKTRKQTRSAREEPPPPAEEPPDEPPEGDLFGGLSDEDRNDLADLGWDCQGPEPVLTMEQRSEVIQLLATIGKIVPEDCLAYLGETLGHPIEGTAQIRVTELLEIRRAVRERLEEAKPAAKEETAY